MSADPALKLHAPEPTTPAPSTAPHAVERSAAGKRLIRLKDLFDLLDVSKPTGHRLLAAGKVGPRRIRFSSGCVRFDGDEVDAWFANRRPDGSLYDGESWPPVWASIQQKNRS